jgi:cytoskeletal protein CcmA (bactofilin family)
MANPLSEKSNSARYSQSRTDTRIGTGVRVEGNITFTGVLRIQGDILGDVSCDADIGGTIVVGQSGNVTGTIRVPHIDVSGRVSGLVHSSESIEIQQGAYVAGEVFYKVIDIHAGGVIEGSLTPRVLMDGDQVKREDRIQSLEPPAVKEYGMPSANAVPAGSRFGDRFGGARKFGGAAALLIAVVAVVLTIRNPALIASPAADIAREANSSTKNASAVQSAPVGSDGLQDSPGAVGGNAISPVPRSDANAKSAVQASRSNLPVKEQGNVVAVQGFNPSKPADIFWAISKAPSVLYKKKRQDPADGTRIDISEGATESIAIAKDEIFRVANGRDIEIFYQGRKVAQNTIESGAWMSFVPQSPSEAGDIK